MSRYESTRPTVNNHSDAPKKMLEYSVLSRDENGIWHEQILWDGDIYECVTHGTVGEC